MCCATGKRTERGFSLVELLVALTVLLIGVSGVMTLYMSSMKAASYSRHATEAVALGEGKMEALRTIPLFMLEFDCNQGNPCEDQVAADGTSEGAGAEFTRTWFVTDPALSPTLPPTDPSLRNVTVQVTWQERGRQVELVFRSQRAQ